MSDDINVSLDNAVLERTRVEEKINQGEFLLIGGDEKVLASLPSGNWIAGTIPYFMTEEGGKTDQERLYVTTVRGLEPSQPARITLYDNQTIERVAKEAPENGFTILILPASSDVHLSYAQNAPNYENMFFSPIVGWVSGVHLDELGSQSAKVGFGPASGLLTDTQAVAMHIPIPEHQVANIKTVNLFKPGSGDVIRFNGTGFVANDCVVNGETMNFADYLRDRKIDTRLPLVADYSGVIVNVSVQDISDKEVALYAPVFADVDYRIAEPIDDYIKQFEQALPQGDANNIAFSCNCILNFLYSDLEGKKTGSLTGPITFGEVAYQLLNQTMVYLTLEES